MKVLRNTVLQTYVQTAFAGSIGTGCVLCGDCGECEALRGTALSQQTRGEAATKAARNEDGEAGRTGEAGRRAVR